MALNISKAFQALTSNDKPKTRSGYGVTSEMTIPPGWNTSNYLQAYGQVGWLFGAVSLIATSVAEVEWHLFAGDKELDNHPLLDLINKANPFQTRYELFLMMQTYRCLVGKSFIALNYTGRLPTEMWIAPPQYMTIVPSKVNYIAGYKYREGDNEILFAPQEIIYISSPNPLNPMDGMGAVQPIATDLQNEVYATKYTNKLFYNDAVPGFAIEVPEMYTAEQRKEYQEDWDARHKGLSNARKTAFLWGGAKINTITMTNRDMDFEALRKLDRETILGAFHIPTSLMGLAEVGSRARAEADEYIFAKRVVKPALQAIKEAFNEQLCPLFGDDLSLIFDDPVPKNQEQVDLSTRANFQAGIITREEARTVLGFDPVPEDGDTFLLPFSLSPVIVGEEPEPEPEPAPIAPPAPVEEPEEDPEDMDEEGKGYSPEQLEQRWISYITKTNKMEPAFKKSLRQYWNTQKNEIIANLIRNPSVEGALFSDEKANDTFSDKFKPLISMAVTEGWNDALSEFGKGYKSKGAFNVLNHLALDWIATRSLSLANMVNGTTKKELRVVLAEGFKNGLSMQKITASIIQFYKDGYEKRASLVARTEVITASAKGSNLLYKEEGVQKVQWYTALDERTCPECEDLHNNVYPIDDGPRPSLHPNCRCVITAHFS